MLVHLKVSNYALIDNLELDFSSGFTVLTGETGSGKSILLGALGLVLGERADSKVLFTSDKKCVVEADFRLNKNKCSKFFIENELDYEIITTIRREINSAGKSRAFINDSLVNLSQLKELASQLIDIHSQHQTLKVRKSDFQLAVLDAYASSKSICLEYHSKFSELKKAQIVLNELENAEIKARADVDYNQFLFNELTEISLEGVHVDALESQLTMLSNAERLKELAVSFTEGLSGDESVLNQLNELKSSIDNLAKISPDFELIADRFISTLIEIKDISEEVEIKTMDLAHDPEQINSLTEQLNHINRLLFKHNCETTEELIDLKQKLEKKLLWVSSVGNDLDNAKLIVTELLSEVIALGEKLSLKRELAIPGLAASMESLLDSLAMKDVQFQFELEKLATPSVSGLNRLSLHVKFNKGSDFLPIEKAASGGELSRIMLAFKVVLSEESDLPTIVFDEIDTGVSGEIANRVAELLASISKNMQVVSISHVPQMASKGQQHYKVYKETSEGITNTKITVLNTDQRLVEIAEMLSGKNPSEAAVQNARELLN
ncbi:DNA repair protein RecN [Flavobacteriales bacterium]|nr:DNA repair protein RecN [Flavobacteriales bacterium]